MNYIKIDRKLVDIPDRGIHAILLNFVDEILVKGIRKVHP